MKYLLLLLMAGCCNSDGSKDNYFDQLQVEKVGQGFYRFENSEVLCYRVYNNTLQCKFKNQ